MSAFTLDTSGAIRLVPAKSDPDGPIIRWTDLDPVTQGYMTEAARDLAERLPGLADRKTPSERVAFRNWSPSALERIVRDCGEMVRVRIAADMPTDPATGASYWRWRQDGILTSWSALTVSLDDAGKVTLADRVRA